MKKWIVFLTVLTVLLCCTTAVFATDGHVTYDGNAREFIFAPGSSYSPTDLFADLKGVMPGDTRTQNITVKNDAARNVKTNIYLRSEYADTDSRDFLSQLQFTLTVGNANGQAYMFSPAGALTPDNDGWVLLGTLYSGGEVDLSLVLKVPTDLDNQYMDRIGTVDWIFKVEELDTEPSDPQPPPKTGEAETWPILLVIAGAALVVILALTLSANKRYTKS